MTARQRLVLSDLERRQGPSSTRQIADRLESARPGTPRLSTRQADGRLRRLEAKGLVSLVGGLWRITPEGREALWEAREDA